MTANLSCIFSRMACQRNFDSRVSYKRRDLFLLLYRVFKQISLQKLPTCFQWDYCNVKDNEDEIQGKYRQCRNCWGWIFHSSFPKNEETRQFNVEKSRCNKEWKTKSFPNKMVQRLRPHWGRNRLEKNIWACENMHKKYQNYYFPI